jgi:hypothetical protein
LLRRRDEEGEKAAERKSRITAGEANHRHNNRVTNFRGSKIIKITRAQEGQTKKRGGGEMGSTGPNVLN